jgi:Na+/H+ antiporter NhaC
MLSIVASLVVLVVVIFWKKNALLAISSALVMLVFCSSLFNQDFLFSSIQITQSVFISTEHWKIIGFSFGINWMVFWLNKERFLQIVTSRVIKSIKSRKGGLHLINLLGYIIFFDDYANTMLIGGIGQELAEKYKISKEKLAYIVDATAAPIASISLVSTWIGFEVGLIEKALLEANLSDYISGYSVFLESIPYMFYAWFTLIFIFILNFSGKDFGPMHAAEKAKILEKTNVIPESPSSMLPSIIVFIGFMFFVVFHLLVYQSWHSDVKFSFETIKNADFVSALFWSSGFAIALIFIIEAFRWKLNDFLGAFSKTFKVFVPILLLLFAAWTYGDIIKEIVLGNRAVFDYLIALNSESIIIGTFVIAIVLSAITGSSWSTMSILFPIVLPVILVGDNATIVELPICCAAIMSGAVIGDHISPISDTTILSAVACGCSVESHFKTQAPYALIVAGISLIALISSTTFTVPIWIIFVVGILLIVVIISLLGRNFQN